MSEPKERELPAAPPRGCLARLTVWLLMLAAVGLGFALHAISKPQDLADIQGYTPESRALLRRDIPRILQSSLDRSYPVTLKEGEINDYLRGVLVAKQGGMLAEKVSLEGVWVRLEAGRAELVLERKVWGRPFTVSMFMKIEMVEAADGRITKYVHRHGGQYHEFLPIPKRGGRFGQLVVPQGFLILIWPSIEGLAKVYENELRLAGEEMARTKIEGGKLVFDPRPNTRTVPLPGGQ